MERDKRFSQVGVNSAGDPVYARNYGDASVRSSDYSTMTKDELQALLKHMALPTSGNKDELIARLQDAE